MTAASLVELTEPRTKAASLLPFAFGIAWAAWRYGVFSPLHTALFFASLLPIDLATTALNNTLDWRHSARTAGESGFGTDGSLHGLSFLSALAITVALFMVGIFSGVMLALQTDGVVFLAGAAAVAVALVYSAGPLPISRTPFGELFSGVTMGAGIPFIAMYIQFPRGSILPVSLQLNWPRVIVSMNLAELASILFVSLPYVLLIAAVMLANNLRDMSADRDSGRLTLPLVIGRTAALRLFAALQGVAVLIIMVCIALRLLPLFCLAVLLAVPRLISATARFLHSPSDSVPFGISVGNLFITGGLSALGTAAAAALRAF